MITFPDYSFVKKGARVKIIDARYTFKGGADLGTVTDVCSVHRIALVRIDNCHTRHPHAMPFVVLADASTLSEIPDNTTPANPTT